MKNIYYIDAIANEREKQTKRAWQKMWELHTHRTQMNERNTITLYMKTASWIEEKKKKKKRQYIMVCRMFGSKN